MTLTKGTRVRFVTANEIWHHHHGEITRVLPDGHNVRVEHFDGVIHFGFEEVAADD